MRAIVTLFMVGLLVSCSSQHAAVEPVQPSPFPVEMLAEARVQSVDVEAARVEVVLIMASGCSFLSIIMNGV